MILVAVLAVILWAAKQFFGRFLQEMGTKFSALFVRRISASRLLSARALRAYRRAVRANFARHRLGLVSDQAPGSSTVEILKVYVPLQYESGGERSDVYNWLRQQPRVVVLGLPGAGKSMLLKHSMLIWAIDESSSGMRLPVMVDLHRCNGDEAPLPELIEQELARNDVRKGPAFVEEALRAGELAVLLDGLDEVGRDDQDRVTRMLRDFAQNYPRCQVVVTCRTAAYFGQLEPQFPERVYVADFDDANVRRFLSNWPGLTEEQADKLFLDLQHNQQLMRLAASPLLLTMIAYLYGVVLARDGRTLPTSRVAFYEMAVDHLLRRDIVMSRDRRISQYDWQDKLAVLQRVALALQEAPPGRPDRLSIDRAGLMTIVNGMLPDLNLDAEHARPLVQEIDERSHLLVTLDRSNSRYAFPHLTLQEYLAAMELAARPDTLLERYFADPAGWRETVKLWCGGSSRECTEVVRTIFDTGADHDRILALECLAEAKRVDNQLATSIIAHFLRRLTEPSDRQGAVVNALSTVASDTRPRGKYVFTELVKRSQRGQPMRQVATTALAKTRLPQAVEILATMAATGDEHARQALRSMGEQAIPALRTQIAHGVLPAVDDLAFVGTPAAAQALAESLWSDDPEAIRAAWRLAELLQQEDIEAHLRLHDPAPGLTGASADWISAPFRGPDAGHLPKIIGRMGFLLDRSPDHPPGIAHIDARLAIPLGVVRGAEQAKASPYAPPRLLKNLIRDVSPNITYPTWEDVDRVLERAAPDAPTTRAICAEVLATHGVSGRRRAIIGMLDDTSRVEAVRRVFCRRDPRASPQHWSTVNSEPRRPTLALVLLVACAAPLALAVAGLGIGRLLGTLFGFWPLGPDWLTWTLLAVMVSVPLLLLLTTFSDSVGIYSPALGRWLNALEEGLLPEAVVAIWALVSICGLGVLAGATLGGWFGWMWSLAVVLALATGTVTFYVIWRRHVDALENPLRPLRDLAALNLGRRMSIISTEAAPT
ncbi:NACHT domain-containing protein [Actinoplanes sp. NPDC048796]|uniref:NACHT domain-containing protein n=1 Tax=Actinoplanes sp. NPDC048796 TaxID=3155640 RepID=UPI0033E538AF